MDDFFFPRQNPLSLLAGMGVPPAEEENNYRIGRDLRVREKSTKIRKPLTERGLGIRNIII